MLFYKNVKNWLRIIIIILRIQLSLTTTYTTCIYLFFFSIYILEMLYKIYVSR